MADPPLRSTALLTAGLAIGLGLYALSLSAPLMVVHPGFGAHTELINHLFPDLGASRAITLWGGLVDLWVSGAIDLALLLGVFSVLFPCLKFAVCTLTLMGAPRRLFLRFFHTFGILSMGEVVFVAVFALTLKSLPGGTSVEAGWGLGIFCVSVVILSVVTAALHWRMTHATE